MTIGAGDNGNAKDFRRVLIGGPNNGILIASNYPAFVESLGSESQLVAINFV